MKVNAFLTVPTAPRMPTAMEWNAAPIRCAECPAGPAGRARPAGGMGAATRARSPTATARVSATTFLARWYPIAVSASASAKVVRMGSSAPPTSSVSTNQAPASTVRPTTNARDESADSIRSVGSNADVVRPMNGATKEAATLLHVRKTPRAVVASAVRILCVVRIAALAMTR